MSSYISPYKSSCIYCSDEVSVCSFLGYRSRIPVDKSLARSSSCSSEDSGTENASSKRACPSQRSRQSKKTKNTLKCSSFKKSAKCQKQRPNPAVTKALQQKRKLNKESESCSPEPLFKAVILREMIRLGRQPKSTFGKAAKSARSSRKCAPKRSCKAENLSENPANLMEMLFGTQENAIENAVEFESFHSLISNEVPRTPSFEHEVQVHNQDYPQQMENLGSANTEFESSLMDLDEESAWTAPHYILEEPDSASDNNSSELKSTMSSQ